MVRTEIERKYSRVVEMVHDPKLLRIHLLVNYVRRLRDYRMKQRRIQHPGGNIYIDTEPSPNESLVLHVVFI
jgi:hypothetical protein